MKKTLTSLILGTALLMPIASSIPSKTYASEERAVAADSKLPSKEKYTFEDFKQALGKRYETLSETDKKYLKNIYNKTSAKHSELFKKIIPEVYKYPERFYKSLNEETREDIQTLNLKNMPDKTKYQSLFPWIKKDFFENDSINASNPDKILLYFAFCNDVDIKIQIPFLLEQNKK